MQEWHLVVAICSLVVAVIVVIININKNRNDVLKKIENDIVAAKTEATKELQAAKEDGEAKRGRLYERLDEVKKDTVEKMEKARKEMADYFVQQQMCSLMHKNVDKTIAENRETTDRTIAKIEEQVSKIFDQIYQINQKLQK